VDGVAAAEFVGPTEINFREYAFSEKRQMSPIHFDDWEDSEIPSMYDASVLKLQQGTWNKEGRREMRNTYRILHFNLLYYTVLPLHNKK
jgi:hypothetical protein